MGVLEANYSKSIPHFVFLTDGAEVDVRDLVDYGQSNIYLNGTPVETAPTIDGVVDENEYQTDFVIGNDNRSKYLTYQFGSAATAAHLEKVDTYFEKGNITEYYAYDKDYVYIALNMPAGEKDDLQFNISAQDSPDPRAYYAREAIYVSSSADGGSYWWILPSRAQVQTSASGKLMYAPVKAGATDNGAWIEGKFQAKGYSMVFREPTAEQTKDWLTVEATDKDGMRTYEFKIAKEFLAHSFMLHRGHLPRSP